MTSQPPLMETSGATLPGPDFAPRPGWGGQLRSWLSTNTYTFVFRTVVLIAIILVARSVWLHAPAIDLALSPSPTTSPRESFGFTIKANPGDGMTNLAARAVDLFVAVQSRIIRLDAAQHLFAVDTLARTTCWCSLKANQTVSFTNVDIMTAVDSALAMTPAQHAAWARLLSK